ncbi:unnamed protein product [Heligmosomoides polygyrus]|uniref:Uncharacterized protein n=1 Tax=Heligmosomoides polygyrus TaxID=6339 RepID=A0A183GQX6_HELPZ|nr:unnamed protein product [Heligmosomoides polygyrus]
MDESGVEAEPGPWVSFVACHYSSSRESVPQSINTEPFLAAVPRTSPTQVDPAPPQLHGSWAEHIEVKGSTVLSRRKRLMALAPLN